MFLKSMTLRGFKSFAEKTQLTFEPGITVIVGPNGSGKSNVSDALAWVLGTSSAKSLRGGSMADVIFAGAPGRSALGRAAVEITIDNAAGTLPTEFSEVSVSRAMFATGETSYAINDVDCRLLDVQELLSDTGLGREHHTIVGQGQLDAVLNAKPEERRVFIEEAAGILKHRRRRERALRKLAQMESHLERLNDILRELRRTLRPLERQAEAAAKHAELQQALREVRVTRALRELRELSDRWAAEEAAAAAAGSRLAVLEQEGAGLRSAEAAVEAELARLAPEARTAGETHFGLANLAERFRGLAGRIAERRGGLVEAVEEPVAGRDPGQLREEAAGERSALEGLRADHAAAMTALTTAQAARREAEQARRAHEQAAAAEARRRAEARERVLRWEGEVAAVRSALAQAAGEGGRLASQVSGLAARNAELQADLAAVESEVGRLDARKVVAARRRAAARDGVARHQAAADAAALLERELERRRARLDARADALSAASRGSGEGAAAVAEAAAAGDIAGVAGTLADHVRVVDDLADAVAAALGPLGDALVVHGRGAAADAIDYARSRGGGRIVLLPVDGGTEAAPPSCDDAAIVGLGARRAVDGLLGDPPVRGALAHALADVYVVDAFTTACRLAERFPRQVFVSCDGEIAGARGYAGGSASPATAVANRVAADRAAAEADEAARDLEAARPTVADADDGLRAARRELDAATAELHSCDGLITAAAERLRRLRNELAACEREQSALAAQEDDLAREVGAQRERLAGLESRGAAAAATVTADEERPDVEAERLEDALAEAREREVQARLAAGAVAQREQEALRRVSALDREADDVERQLAERERRRLARLEAIDRCGELAAVATAALGRAEDSVALAAAERDRLEDERAARQRRLGAVRAELRELSDRLTAGRSERHHEELARQELAHALAAVRDRLASRLSLPPDAALAEAAASTFTGGAERDAELAEAEERLTRKVALLGTVNPLALEEFHAQQERHAFLAGQLEDLRSSRRDLLQVVDAVDERIREVFAAAFADVAAQFERIFPRLFPGGEGRLVLTDPDDLLDTGVEVEARPPGKRVKRLSLLSGGERSLTALAVLFAIFAARPSPFYVLDEVEAALDDVNLQRFLDVVVDFRGASQMLIVTHQKRTMEIADCLYGITMRGDGVSKVVSQRISEPAPA